MSSSEWGSWGSLWRFLAHLDDLDFYKGLDKQCEICIASSASRRKGMNILFLTSAHNSLSQRLLIELTERGHQVSVALATSDEAMITAVAQHVPDLLIAPMLKVTRRAESHEKTPAA